MQCALRCTKRIFRQGFQYKRAGVIVMGICPENGVQTNLLDYDPVRYEKLKRLDEVIDRIKRNKHANGKALDGKIVQQMPE